MKVTNAMIEAVVAAEAPSFPRLRKVMQKHGFTVATYFTEHQQHAMRGEWHSQCGDCLALTRAEAERRDLQARLDDGCVLCTWPFDEPQPDVGHPPSDGQPVRWGVGWAHRGCAIDESKASMPT